MFLRSAVPIRNSKPCVGIFCAGFPFPGALKYWIWGAEPVC